MVEVSEIIYFLVDMVCRAEEEIDVNTMHFDIPDRKDGGYNTIQYFFPNQGGP
jgi:hypothetical protein